MGTEKRERQKAGRQSRRAEAEAVARKARTRGAFVKWGVFAAIILAIVIGFAVFGGDDDNNDTATTPVTESTTTVPTNTVPPTPCPPVDGTAEPVREFDAPFAMCIDSAKSYTAVLTYNVGELRVDLDAERAPDTVNNFVALARSKYFDDTVCHRIIPGFMAQCGDPTASGRGGPGYRFDDELENQGPYQIGSLAMANSGPNTNGSQFFVITGPQGVGLDPDYTLFGQAEPGQDEFIAALDAAGNPDPAANGVPPKETITLQSVTIVES